VKAIEEKWEDRQTVGSGEDDWREETFALPFRIGEVTLFQVPLRVLKWRRHFLEIAPETSPGPPPRLPTDTCTIAVDTSRPIVSRLSRFSIVDDCLRYVTWQYSRQYVRLGGDFAAYEAAFHRKTRATLRRKVRKFAGVREEPDFRVFRSSGEMIDFWEDARCISARSFQERFLGQGLPDSEAFRKEVAAAADRGDVVGWILYSENRPVAYTLGQSVAPGVIQYGHTGYDPEYRALSPGTVLQYLVIRFLFDEAKFEVYDLCVGEAEHKRLFANEDQLCADVMFFRKTPLNIVLATAHFGLAWINEAIIGVLDALHLKQGVKKALRRSGRGSGSTAA